MGNIITQANDDARAYTVDDIGNLSLTNTLNAKTGVFDNTSWFKDNIIVDGTVDGVDILALKTTVDGMSGAGQGTFTGKSVAALNFTGTSGNFNNLTVSDTGTFETIKTSVLDINGNITNTTGPKYITASNDVGLKLENGSTASNGYVQVNSDGSISIIPYTGKFLVLGGDMTGSGSINMDTGTFNSLTATTANMTNANVNGNLYVSGKYSDTGLNTPGQITTTDSRNNLAIGTTADTGTLLLSRNTILSSGKILTLDGSMTGTGSINAGSLTLSGELTGTSGTFNGLLTARTDANIMGSFTGATGTFTNLLNASGGLTTTSLTGTSIATIGGMLNANGGITLPSGSIMTFGGNMTGAGNINAGAGTFSSLTLTSALTGTFGTFSSMLNANGGLTLPSTSILTLGGNMTGTGNINAGVGTFSSVTTTGAISGGAGTFNNALTANGGLTLPLTATLNLGGNMTGTGNINAGAGTFSNALTANGGLTLPSTATLNLRGNMTGAGNIDLGNILTINQTTTPTFSSSMTNATNGLVIKGTNNNWSIGEVKGTAGTARLCFSYNGTPFACIDPISKNLVSGTTTWA